MQVRQPLRKSRNWPTGRAVSKITPFLGYLRPLAWALALRAKMGSAVSPGLASNGGLAPSARLIGLPVSEKLLGEVASLAVDILVLLVE
jgi:hypothetical protein